MFRTKSSTDNNFPDTPAPVRSKPATAAGRHPFLEPPDLIELGPDEISRPSSASYVWDFYQHIYDEVNPDMPPTLDPTLAYEMQSEFPVPVNISKIMRNIFELFTTVQGLNNPTDPNFIECEIRLKVLSREFESNIGSIPESHLLYPNIDQARLKLLQCRERLERLEQSRTLQNVSTSPIYTQPGVSSLDRHRVSLGSASSSGISDVERFAALVNKQLIEFQSSITASVEKRVGSLERATNELNIITNDSILPICHANSKVSNTNKTVLNALAQSVSLNTSKITSSEQSITDLQNSKFVTDLNVSGLSNKVDLLSAKFIELQAGVYLSGARAPSVILGDHLPSSTDTLYTPLTKNVSTVDVNPAILLKFPQGYPPSYSTFENVFTSPPSFDNLTTPPPRGHGRPLNGISPLSSIPLPSPPDNLSSVSNNGSTTDPSTEKYNKYKRRLTDTGSRILSITNTDFSSITNKSHILALEAYEGKRLAELKKVFVAIESKLEDFSNSDLQTDTYIDTVFARIYTWESSLDDLKKKFHCHLNPEKSLLKSIELPKFTGDDDTTIYEFLSLFEAQSEHCCSPPEKAALLYATYLGSEIQREVEAMKNSYDGMKSYLIRRHGDLRTIFDIRTRRIAGLEHPRSSQLAKISYYKKIYQLLRNCEAITSSGLVITREVESILYSSSFVLNVCSYLPDDFIKKFSCKMEKESLGGLPSGHRYFELLLRSVESQWKEMEGFQSIKAYRENPRSDALKSKSSNVVESRKGCSSVPQPNATVATSCIASGSSFPCDLHDKAKPHDLGTCQEFFSGTNNDRFLMCFNAKVCFTCMKADCLKQGRKCITKNLPSLLICEDCAKVPRKAGRVLNVLVCSKQGHTKPSLSDLENALFSYLKVFDPKLIDSVKSSFVLINCNVNSPTGCKPKSNSGPVDPSYKVPAFDTATGKQITVPKDYYHDQKDDVIFVFQVLEINMTNCLIFYDSGSQGNLVKGSFAEQAKFKVLTPDPQMITGVGDRSMFTDYGVYSAIIGSESAGFYEVISQGMTNITSTFPEYDYSVFHQEVWNYGRLRRGTPLPSKVGGSDIDLLIGLKQTRLTPVLKFVLPSGLGVFECKFQDIYGSTIAFGGSHNVISQLNHTFGNFSVNQMSVLLSEMSSQYMGQPWVVMGDSFVQKRGLTLPYGEHHTARFSCTPLGLNEIVDLQLYDELPHLIAEPNLESCGNHRAQTIDDGFQLNQSKAPDSTCIVCKAKFPIGKLKKLMIYDDEDFVASYRCEKCSDCADCKLSPSLKATSIRDKLEQKIVEASVHIDYEKKKTFVSLPFLEDPVPFFQKHFNGANSNYDQAFSTYQQQCRKDNSIKEGIRSEMQKLADSGFIAPLDSASQELQDLVEASQIQHLYPWRSVSNPSSMSTTTRVIVDPTSSFLNLILPKGEGGVACLTDILLRSRLGKYSFTSDIKKLYNNLWLNSDSIPYSLFLYHPSLDISVPPKVFYMRTAWYGVVVTAAQAAVAIRRVAKDHLDTHPMGAKTLLEQTYVDDLSSPSATIGDREETISQAVEILSKAGLSTKYIIRSHEPPPEEASADGYSVFTLGYRWDCEKDLLSLGMDELNFHKKVRGAKKENPFSVDGEDDVTRLVNTVPFFTKVMCVSKSAEIWDPLGIVEPVKACFKRLLSNLNSIDWKDRIPDDQTDLWTHYLKMFPALKALQFPRSAIPFDALVPEEARLILCSDAAVDCGGAVCYISYRLTSGQWSSNLLTARSRLMRYSIPRNELSSLLMAVELMFSVVVASKITFSEIILATDSTIALSWASNHDARNRTFVYNRVAAIDRLIRWTRSRLPSASIEMVHIETLVNPADLLTKGVIHPSSIGIGSSWQSGMPWMSLNRVDMPFTTYHQLKLSAEEKTVCSQETMISYTPIEPVTYEEDNFDISLQETDFGPLVVCICNPPLPVFPSCKGGRVTVAVQSNLLKQGKPIIDIIHRGFEKANHILETAVFIALKWFHKTHLNSSTGICDQMARRCVICLGKSSLATPQENGDSITVQTCGNHEDGILDLSFIRSAATGIVSCYWDTIATQECLRALKPAELIQYEQNDEGILFYKGRVDSNQTVFTQDLDLENSNFFDNEELNFHNPCIIATSELFFVYALYVHNKVVPHAGLETTLMHVSKRFHPIGGRRVLAKILANCIKCRLIQKATLQHEMGKHSSVRFTICAPFTFAMIDLCQDFSCKTRFQGRQVQKVPALCIVCLTTGATNLLLCESWESQAVALAINRHSCRYGIPHTLFVDAGSALLKLKDLTFSLSDLKREIKHNVHIEVHAAPPKAHNFQGRVERKIGHIKVMLRKLNAFSFLNSFLMWETIFAIVCNAINDLPICRNSARSVTRPEYNILTPNRLLLGRSNARSQVGPFILPGSPSSMLERVQKVQEEFFRIFLKSLHLFIPCPKWFKSDLLEVNDIVVFFTQESFKVHSCSWHYAQVTEVHGNRLTLRYFQGQQGSEKTIERQKRDVVRVASMEELNMSSADHFKKLCK